MLLQEPIAQQLLQSKGLPIWLTAGAAARSMPTRWRASRQSTPP